ncbi:MAG: ATP-binding protein [Tepidiformaceae bacterium]
MSDQTFLSPSESPTPPIELKRAPVLLWVASVDGRRTYFNEAWLDFRGRSLAEELGFGWLSGIHVDDRSRVLGEYQSTIGRGEVQHVQYRLGTADGAYREVLDCVRFLEGKGAVVGATIDISDLKQAQAETADAERRADEALVARDRVLDLVSHELRTPLTGVLGFAALLNQRSGGMDVVGQEAARLLVQDVERLSEVIQNMLVLANPDSPSLSAEPVLLQRTIGLVALDHERHHHRQVVTDGLDPTLEPVLAREDSLRHVVTNLLSNVEKYSPVTEPVHLTATRSEGFARVIVSNRGVGFSPDELDAVFEPFYRGTAAELTQAPGAGLGLAVVRHLVTGVGGAVWAHPPRDGWTDVGFSVPIAP